MALNPIPVIDGHNDTLTKIRNAPKGERRSFLERSGHGHLDLPRARDGGLVGGFCSIFTASPNYKLHISALFDDDGDLVVGGRAVALPPKLDRRKALVYTLSVISDLLRLETESEGQVEVVRGIEQLRSCLDRGVFAAICHVEGAEAIDTRLETLDVLYAAGLRSLGPVWSRPNAFAHGVPFDFPRSPDTGPGLTRAGRALVKRCNRLGILVDLSHLTGNGFWEVATISEAPLVATHSNAHALCPSPRNLTDEQLDEIKLTDGVVGLNFHVGFLRPDGNADAVTSMHEIVEHARYVADRIGVEHLALGSDFDGATMPVDLPDASHLPALLDAFHRHGFSEGEVRSIAYENWIRVLARTWSD